MNVTSCPQELQRAAPIGLKESQRPQTIPTSSDPKAMNPSVILPLAGPAKGYELAAPLAVSARALVRFSPFVNPAS